MQAVAQHSAVRSLEQKAVLPGPDDPKELIGTVGFLPDQDLTGIPVVFQTFRVFSICLPPDRINPIACFRVRLQHKAELLGLIPDPGPDNQLRLLQVRILGNGYHHGGVVSRSQGYGPGKITDRHAFRDRPPEGRYVRCIFRRV